MPTVDMPLPTTVRSCLAALGPHAPGLLEATNSDPVEFVEAVRRQAHTQRDMKLPLLMSDSDVPSADALYAYYNNGGGGGGVYTETDSAAPGKGSVLRGAGMIDACGVSCAALVTSRGCNVEVHVAGAPLAALESELFETRAEHGALLEAWLGFEAAWASHDFRKRLGCEMRSIGPSAVEDMLGGSYGVSRTGPAGALALRPASSPEELRVLFNGIETGIENGMTNGVEDTWVEAHYANPCKMIVHWDTKPWPHCENVSESALKNWQKWPRCVPRLADLLLRCPVGDAPACLEFGTDYENRIMELLKAASTPVPGHERLCIDQLDAVSCPMRKNTLYGLVGAAVAMCAPRRLGVATDRACMVELFDEADALFAVRSLGLTRQADPEAIVTAVMERVASPGAALLVVLNEDETIKHVRLLAHGRNGALTFDAAQRLLSCPWAVPLALKEDQLCILEVAGINRVKLRIASSYLVAFNKTAGPSPATAGDVAALRTHIESLAAAVTEARVTEPTGASADATPAPEALSSSLLLTRLRNAMHSMQSVA